MHYCCVPSCNSRNGGKEKISFHEFPSNLELWNKWCEIISTVAGLGSSWQPSDYSRVCEKHFAPSDFSKSTKLKRLLSNSIPLIFENVPAYKVLKFTSKKEEQPTFNQQPTSNATARKDPLNELIEKIRAQKRSAEKQGSDVLVSKTSSDNNEHIFECKSSNKLSTYSKTQRIPGNKKIPFKKQCIEKQNPECLVSEANPSSDEPVLDDNPSNELPATSLGTHYINEQSISITNSDDDKLDKQTTFQPLSIGSAKTKKIMKKLHSELKNLRRSNARLRYSIQVKNQEIMSLKSEKKKESFEEKQLKKIMQESSENIFAAEILLDQIKNFGKKKVALSSNASEIYYNWQKMSPKGYKFVRDMKLLALPHRNTLKKATESIEKDEERSCDITVENQDQSQDSLIIDGK